MTPQKMVVDDEGLNHWIAALIDHGYTVIAPRLEAGRVRYGVIEEGSEFMREYTNPQNSPKDFLFPQREELLRATQDGTLVETFPPVAKQVFLGVRPCDAMAIQRLDQLFNWDTADARYNQRRGAAAVMGLACNTPQASCFCTALGEGLGPHHKTQVDVMMTQLDRGSYLVEAISAGGKTLLSCLPGGAPATPHHEAQALKLKTQAESRLTKRLDLENTFRVLDENFDSAYWKTVARTCIGCGICTYLCPTCHCFDIQDEGSRRVRFWDSCQFALYSKHAAGHNPRDQPYKRLRNRVYHKFVYFQKNLGTTLCVGCGRCTTYCPSTVDLFKIVSEAEAGIADHRRAEATP
jgi:sulfhydrogenase subunit beta (sulfur reductase)